MFTKGSFPISVRLWHCPPILGKATVIASIVDSVLTWNLYVFNVDEEKD